MVDQLYTTSNRPSRTINISLWIAQVLIFGQFVFSGSLKLLLSIEKLTALIHWPADYPAWFTRMTGVFDLAGGIGVLLPALTRIRPRLTVAAACGCIALQACAIAFHMSRGEAARTPLNFVLVSLCIFIVWGRTKKVPIEHRI